MVRSDASRSRSPVRPPKEELIFPDNQLGMSPSYFKSIGAGDFLEAPLPSVMSVMSSEPVERPLSSSPSEIRETDIEGEDDNESGSAAACNLDDDDALVLAECLMAKQRENLERFQILKRIRTLHLKKLKLLRLLMFFKSLLEFERSNM